MTSQNTQKQIIAMVVLMAIGVLSLGAYIWFDVGRRAEAEDQQVIEASERGAHLFAANCRVCHGNTGLGRDGDSRLIGQALNTPANTLAFRTENSNALQELQARLESTVHCGRNGTPMPAWSIDEGGSLSFFKIENLVTLITTNAGNMWEEAELLAIEHDEVQLATLKGSLAEAEATGDAQRIVAAQERLDRSQIRFDVGLPIQEPMPSLTQNTCGQRTVDAADSGDGGSSADAIDEIGTSGFTADADRGQELFFANGCNICHGEQGEGLIGPQIAGTVLTYTQVVNQYRNPRQAMSQFSADAVPNEDVFDIYTWLQTLGN